jgi:hypothetical protein
MRLHFKIPLFGVIGIALLIMIGLVLLYQSHILENWVNRYLADKIAEEYNLDVTIAEIDGSFVKGFILSDVLIRFYEEADTITLAYIPRISIDYSVSDLWHRRWIINTVGITRPQFYLETDSLGNWRLPKIPKGETSDSPPTSWEFKYIAMEGASFDLTWKDRNYRWFDINLISSAKSEAGTYTFSLDSMRLNSEDERLRVNYARALATIFGDKSALQDVTIVTDSSRLAFSLARDAGEDNWMKAEVDSSHIHLPDIVSFLGLNLTGDVDLAGTLYRQYGRTGGNLLLSGEFQKRWLDSIHVGFHYDEGVLFLDTMHGDFLKGCRVAGYGSVDFMARPKVYHLAARIDSFNLKNIVFNSYETDLNGYLELDARGFKSDNMALDFDLSLDESYFDIYHFHRAAGQMTVSRKGLYLFPGFRVNYHSNRFQCEGGVDYYGDINIDCRADLADLSDFEHQTFIDLPAGRGEAEFSFTGPTNDPDLRAHFISDSIWLYEFFSGDFETDFFVQSFVNRMRGPVIIRCNRGDAWGFPYDSIFGEFTLDSNLLYIDTACLANNFSRTEVTGLLDFENYPQELVLDSVAIDLTGRRFAGQGNQLILIDSLGYMFDRININASQGNLSFSGRVDYSDSLDIIWEINNIAMAPWVELLNDSLELNGRLLSVGSIFNTMENPEFSLQAQIDSLQYEGLHLGNLQTFLSYEDSVLLIDSSYLKSPEGLYTATGDFPINLSMGSRHDFFDDREQDIAITAADRRLDLAAFLLESVEYINGDFTAEIDLTGKPLEPHLNGVCRLKDGTVKLLDLQDKLEQVEIELEMSDRLMTITRAEGMIPRGSGRTPGRVSGKGTILVRDINRFMYALNVDATKMPIKYELGDVTGLVNAKISVNGDTPPLVTGTIDVPSATYRESFEETGFSLLSALEADKTWDLDLMVEFPSNFWVKNDEIEAEFAGDINILRDAGVYNFLGTLEVIRGKYFFFDKTFKMTPGGQINYENIREPDPKLDMEISTRINTRSSYSEYQGDDNYSYELYLSVTGTLNNPIFSGTGEAPISNEDMLLAILGDYRPDVDTLGENDVLANRITVGGANLLASQFSRLGTRTLGVETFEIYPDMENGFDPLGTRVTIGAYTLPNLYVFGSSYFDINKGQEVGMEYRLGRYYLFEGRRDESNLYHLNLKFYWEFGNGDEGEDDK